MKKLTVLMVICAHDNYDYLKQSIKSICNQKMKPSELVLVINGYLRKNYLRDISKNFSSMINLKIFTLKKNHGLAYALNFGLSKCESELIARMDPDDISLPGRLITQYEFMKKNPNIAVSSAWIEEFSEDFKESKGIRTTPMGEIKLENKYAKLRSPLNHIPAIIRKSIILKVGGYPNFKKGQDYALWSLLLVNGYSIYNIPEVLAHVRSSSFKTDRRGISRLYHEIPLLFYQYRISFLSFYEFIFSLTIRVIMRLLPYQLRKIVFKRLRLKVEELKNIKMN